MSTRSVQVIVPLKNIGTAYLWWFFLGSFGAHKFYLGRPGMGFLYASTLGVFFVGNIIDLFTLPSQVHAANRRMIDEAGRLYGAQEPDSERAVVREIDFDRYRSASQAPAAAPSAAASRPTFGRRV